MTTRFAIVAAMLLCTSPALAEEPPPTGTPWIVGGSLAAGSGVVNLVGAGLCGVTLPEAQRVPCAATSVAFGIAGLAIGIPLIVVGVQRREARMRWEEHVTVEPRQEGAIVGWRGTW